MVMNIDPLATAWSIRANEPLSSADSSLVLPRSSAALGSGQFRPGGAASAKFPGMRTYEKCVCNPRRMNSYAIRAQTSRAE